MDIRLYQEYLQQYVQEAIRTSDGSNTGIYECLDSMRVTGVLTRHKEEKRRALADAKAAFSEHRHWPLNIVLSHLGIPNPSETEN